MYNTKYCHNGHELREDIIKAQNLIAQMASMEQHYVATSTSNNNVHDHLRPKLKGHVSVEKPNGKFESMDMKVHLTLKSDKKPRSRSLSRYDEPDRKVHSSKSGERGNTCHSAGRKYQRQESRGRKWSEILGQNHRASSNTQETKNSRTTSPDLKGFTQRTDVRSTNTDHNSEVDTLKLLNPVRTIRFLVSELRNSIPLQGQHEHDILSLVEKLLHQIPEQRSHSQADTDAHKHTSSRDQISRTAYEKMRKQCDSLQKQLTEKSHGHLSLERKCASLEAKLTRIRSERDEYREASEKLVVEQTALLAHAQAAISHQQTKGGVSNPHEIASLQEELRAAKKQITTLEASIKKLEDQYHARMKVVLDTLHDGFDFTKNDSAHISEVVGDPPRLNSPIFNPKSDTLKLSLPPTLESKVEQLFSMPPPPLATSNHKFEDYINDFMKNSGFLTEGQISLFQSYQSIPELPPDK